MLGGEIVLPEHLPEILTDTADTSMPAFAGPSTEIVIDENIEFPVNLDEVLASIEKHYLKLALNHSQGVKKKAAELLGMNFRSFRYRLKKFEIAEGIDAPE